MGRGERQVPYSTEKSQYVRGCRHWTGVNAKLSARTCNLQSPGLELLNPQLFCTHLFHTLLIWEMRVSQSIHVIEKTVTPLPLLSLLTLALGMWLVLLITGRWASRGHLDTSTSRTPIGPSDGYLMITLLGCHVQGRRDGAFLPLRSGPKKVPRDAAGVPRHTALIVLWTFDVKMAQGQKRIDLDGISSCMICRGSLSSGFNFIRSVGTSGL